MFRQEKSYAKSMKKKVYQRCASVKIEIEVDKDKIKTSIEMNICRIRLFVIVFSCIVVKKNEITFYNELKRGFFRDIMDQETRIHISLKN